MATDITTEPQAESDADFAKRFAELTAKWKEGTWYHSRIDKIAAHPAHREIVAMGERVVPLLLADLEREPQDPNLWFMALREITGDGPVIPEDDRGRTVKMAAAWVAWGRAKGYRWERDV